MNYDTLTFVLAAGIVSGTPILFAALGETLTERSGVLNLGVEGIMLMGAMTGFGATRLMGNASIGFVVAMLVGALLGLAFGVLAVHMRSDQIVAGLAFSIFCIGLSAFLGKPLIAKQLTSTINPIDIPLLGDIPFFGEILFRQDALVYLTYLLVPALWYLVFRTRPGLVLRTVGENPRAADILGINVARVRYTYTALGGALAAAGGAYLTLAIVPIWLENMTAGRGWIAIAVVIFAGWNPARVIFGAYLFGTLGALTIHGQIIGFPVPTYLLGMSPFVLTILVLILGVLRRGGSAAPAALALPYDSEEK